MVYNMLADHLAAPKTYPHVHPDHLAWPHRWAALQEQLGSLGSDLICLQEVEPFRWAARRCQGGHVYLLG